ncbi:hypothetical protein EJ02DRAFT_55182 [Clathrospora elynae]|uniref:Uncharacterized protein n=1 Tax=Clathrospora elynae TaxID=706981 RepID=A0A6A5SJF6_9PLEO|nr:hypothetical protein EJ02DRAFT_55182 [Clathrospora elynae]
MALLIQPGAGGGRWPGNAISTSTLTPTNRCVPDTTRANEAASMALPIRPRAGGGEQPGYAISTSTPTPTNRRVPDTTRTNKAASTASQTQIWEQTVKNGLALLHLPPLPHHNDSYP